MPAHSFSGWPRRVWILQLNRSQGAIFETYVSFSDIIWVFINIPGQAKVTDFNHVLFRQEDVSRCQVPVDTLQKELCALEFSLADLFDICCDLML